ncbi:helix-turn-helix domain-containing protein [Metabacillus iocasae]|uniref:Transcriptional regulator with XRE-family HTH domain n=1 Tax=Priestia iocasae TaxID=2291674 RepID=A0ABS2QYR4_9BACI|nr:helix-turn-helix transcriptional regulator [Metabacillus iocasae]MBM7704638.1 transcriptional regulator with XRE-family HTH domain [Metabacillus iocasae]
MKSVGQNIQMYRELKKMSQQDLALKVRVGLSAIQKYEKGEQLPDTQVLLRISTVLDIPASELMINDEKHTLFSLDEELLLLIEEIGVKKAKIVLRKVKELNDDEYRDLMKTVYKNKYEEINAPDLK